MSTQTIFISRVQKELAEERRALKAFIERDAPLHRFFTVRLFEDHPAILAAKPATNGAKDHPSSEPPRKQEVNRATRSQMNPKLCEYDCKGKS